MKIFKYLKKYWFYAILAPIFMVVEVMMDLRLVDQMAQLVNEGVMLQNMEVIKSVGISMVITLFIGISGGILCGVFTNLAAQNYGNDLRKDNYDIFVEYHPEMLENYQKQINIVTDSLINEELGEDFRFYPFTIAQTLKNDSKGKIDLDLVSYSKVMLKRSKQKLIKLEKEIEILTEKRDDTICLALKTTPELMATISKKIEDINTEMQATRDKIWTEKNLQNIIHDYLKGRKD